MKVNKSGFIVSLVFTAIFAIGGIALFIMNASSDDLDYSVFALIMFVMAAIFLIAAIASLLSMKKQKKRYEMICNNLSQMDCHAQLIIGAYGEKGAAGKAAAKTAASAIGGLLMALFFGFGAYKVYGANNSAEFVLTDGGLFVGRPTKNGFDFNNMTFIANGQIPATVTVKKNCVLMKNNLTGEYFNFNTKSSGLDSKQLAERLEKFLHPAKIETPAVTVPVDDPFAESTPAQAAAEPVTESKTTVEEAKPVGEEGAKQLPPDDPFAD